MWQGLRAVGATGTRRRKRIRLGTVLGRLAHRYTFDILGRDTAGVVAPAVPGMEVHRETNPDGLLRDAFNEREGGVVERLLQIRPLAARAQRHAHRRRSARFAKGDEAYVATLGDQVVAWAWVGRQPVVHCRWSGLHFVLKPNEAYLYDLWSSLRHRSSNPGAFVMKSMLQDLRERGEVARVYGYVTTDNRPSQVMHRLVLGFQQVQQVKSVRLLSHWAWQLPGTVTPVDGPCVGAAAASRAARIPQQLSPSRVVT